MPEFTESTIHVVAGLAAADLEAPAERVDARLSASDRCRRAHHRPQGLARLGRHCAAGGRAGADAGGRLRRADGGPHHPRSRRRPAASPRPRHGRNRIELSGFTDTMRDRLKAYGLFHEIISWKLRMFVPTDASGVAVLAKVLERYPIERIGEREAA